MNTGFLSIPRQLRQTLNNYIASVFACLKTTSALFSYWNSFGNLKKHSALLRLAKQEGIVFLPRIPTKGGWHVHKRTRLSISQGASLSTCHLKLMGGNLVKSFHWYMCQYTWYTARNISWCYPVQKFILTWALCTLSWHGISPCRSNILC